MHQRVMKDEMTNMTKNFAQWQWEINAMKAVVEKNSLGTNTGADLGRELIWLPIALELSTGFDSYSTPVSLTSVTEVTYEGLEFSSNWTHLKIWISLSQCIAIGKEK